MAVSKLEAIVEDLKMLPADRFDSAADSGFADGDELTCIIEEGCEKIDERHW